MSMQVEDILLDTDGFAVMMHRKKACVSRAEQKIWVNGVFFGWNLLDNLKNYLNFIPSKGPLWRAIPPHPKAVSDAKPLAHSTVDSTPSKMAMKLKLENPSQYHSHSLRRTGAASLTVVIGAVNSIFGSPEVG